MSTAPLASRDAQRHVETRHHHLERAKDERMDRRDGTGRGLEVEKRGGAGKGNWGVVTDTAEAEEVVRAEAEAEADAGPEAVTPSDFQTNDDVLTLEEYEQRKAQQKA